MKEYMYHFHFFTDKELTHDEKMEISKRGLHALKDIARDVAKEKNADHNMSFGFEEV